MRLASKDMFDTTKTGEINSNGPGSLGHSSPDAAAPWGRAMPAMRADL